MLTMPKRLALALAAGSISYFAYPQPNFWPAIFVSVAGLLVSIRGLGVLKAFGVSLVGGAAFYASQIYWISQYLGPEPLIALAGLEAVIFALGMSLIALAYKLVQNRLCLAFFVASIWTGREWVSTHYPYGGFPWSRIAMSQADSPLASWVAVGGFGLLSFVVIFITQIALDFRFALHRSAKIFTAIAVLTVFLVPVILSGIPTNSSGSLRIAGVQGNANAGLFANEVRGTILSNHLAATKMLLNSKTKFDLVVWPENASDENPRYYVEANLALRNLVDNELKEPLIFGTISADGNKFFNSSILWKPGVGQVDRYDKKRPVPFGEYVPDRKFFYSIAPDLVGLISWGYSFGSRDGIFNIKDHKAGILICFEEAIDELPRDVVNQGAEYIVAQTNNADFGHSDESVQQLAIARLRAIETGRSIVSISTVGPSAIIDPKGKVIAGTTAYKRDFIVANVPLSKSKTLTMLGGWMFDPTTAIVSVLFALYGIISSLRRKRAS